MPEDSFIIAEQRAKEAMTHNAKYTFISPGDLLHLIHWYKKIKFEELPMED